MWNTWCLVPSPRSIVTVFLMRLFLNKLMKEILRLGHKWNFWFSLFFKSNSDKKLGTTPFYDSSCQQQGESLKQIGIILS